MIAQGAHASLAAVLKHMKAVEGGWNLEMPLGSAIQKWLTGPFVKICLSVDSEAELLDLLDKAEAAGVPFARIVDAGRTEFNGVPTLTCGAIGPDFPERIDPITGHLQCKI